MAKLLKADADAIRMLGKELDGKAETIREIARPTRPTMPGSPIEAASRTSDREIDLSYSYMAATIETLGEQVSKTALTYEQVDQIFAARLRAYRGGK